MDNYYVCDCATDGGGRVGGLVLLWKETVNMHIADSNNIFIDSYFDTIDIGNPIRHTGIYGYPHHLKKEHHLHCD